MQILPVKIEEMKDSAEVFFIDLYNIHLRTGTIYIAACDQDIYFAGQKYLAIPVQRGDIVRTVDCKTDNVSLKISDVDYEKLTMLLQGFDFRGSKVELFRIAYPDSLENPDLHQIIFFGTIDGPSYSAGVFECTIVNGMPDIEVPARSCQLCCNSEFGDAECGINKDVRTVTLGSGSNSGAIVVETEGDWKDGVVTIEGESRMIRESSDKLYLAYPFFQTVTSGMKATIERGCDKTAQTCKERFDNMKNFSGFPAIPWETVYR